MGPYLLESVAHDKITRYRGEAVRWRLGVLRGSRGDARVRLARHLHAVAARLEAAAQVEPSVENA